MKLIGKRRVNIKANGKPKVTERVFRIIVEVECNHEEDVADIQIYELLTNSAYYTQSQTYTQAETNSQISTAVAGYLPLSGGTNFLYCFLFYF